MNDIANYAFSCVIVVATCALLPWGVSILCTCAHVHVGEALAGLGNVLHLHGVHACVYSEYLQLLYIIIMYVGAPGNRLTIYSRLRISRVHSHAVAKCEICQLSRLFLMYIEIASFSHGGFLVCMRVAELVQQPVTTFTYK